MSFTDIFRLKKLLKNNNQELNMFRIFKAPRFQKKVEKLLTKKELEELNAFIKDLKKGRITGKTLTYEFFREKKIGSKRVYFLVYDDLAIILLVNASNKKYQQETIDEIKILLPEFKRYACELYIKEK